MASLERVNAAIAQLTAFLQPVAALASCHMVDFITRDHWATLLPPALTHDLLQLSREQLHLIPNGALLDYLPGAGTSSGGPDDGGFWQCDLASFLGGVRCHSLPALGLTTPPQELLEMYGCREVHTLALPCVMSEKKSHEVDVMSSFTARMAHALGCGWVLDLGSGKGYLSSALVLQFGLNVLAIDSSSGNIDSAQIRNSRLERRIEKIKETETNRLEGKVVKKGKRKPSKNRVPDPPRADVLAGMRAQGSYVGLTRFINDDTDLVSILRECVGEASQRKADCGFNKESCISEGLEESNLENDGYKLDEGCKDRLVENDKEINNTKVNGEPVPNEMSGSAGPESSQQMERQCLVGLHTCGNLAASSIRLFVANPTVKFLCNVGCCYNLIEEEFCENPFRVQKVEGSDGEDKNAGNPSTQAKPTTTPTTTQATPTGPSNAHHPSELNDLGVGFPLSGALRRARFSLGRNPRMLSCQPADRLTTQSLKGLDALYWRALLQELVHARVGPGEVGHVGRVAAKCDDFAQYVRAATAKLGIHVQDSDEQLLEFASSRAHHRDHIERFFVVRAALAPVIEGLILLDRLAYLKEQDGVRESYLVQLFDPVTSPRCHAIVAVRA